MDDSDPATHESSLSAPEVGASPDAGPQDGLSETERARLVFERSWWKFSGAKESAVRERFGMSMTRYYQVLNAVVDDPAALEVDALTVGRLGRLRAARQRHRTGRAVGGDSA